MSAAPKLSTPRERPILFSGPMVRAILEGRKTQTRRLVKTNLLGGGRRMLAEHVGHWNDDRDPPARWVEPGGWVACPYGAPGDRLWVRETWGYRGSSWNNQRPDENWYRIHYRADDAHREFRFGRDEPPSLPKQPPAKVLDRDATDDEVFERSQELTRYWRSWRPAIHMPRWACRLTLEVTDVRVQRLQDISEEDAKAEGVLLPEVRRICPCETGVADPGPHIDTCSWRNINIDPTGLPHRDEFAILWDSINGKRAPWAGNPWVWAISFRRVEP